MLLLLVRGSLKIALTDSFGVFSASTRDAYWRVDIS